MTKFLAYYNLCTIPEPKDFLGISPDKDKNNIITTLDKNIIIIIKISTQKQIKSWSVLEKLSSKVVYDIKSEKYIGVFGNKYMRCWNETTADVNKCKKLKFHKSIADLVCDKNDTFVMYMDGTCETLNAALESRKNDDGSNKSSQFELFSNLIFSSASIQSFSNGNRILTYFERNIKTEDYHLVRIPLEGENTKAKRFSLKRESLDVYVAGVSVIEGDGVPFLITIWSDKRVFLLSLGDDIEPERSPGNFVSMLTQLKVDTPLSVIGISKHFVAIYGANHGQEGASLLLYNIQYKVIKTKQFFKVYFNFSQLWSIEDHILLAMGQNLSVVKYRVLKEVLSELVGTQVGHDYQTAIEDSQINEDDYFEECLQYERETEQLQLNFLSSNRCDKINIKEADGNYVAFINTKQFDKDLNALKKQSLYLDIGKLEPPINNIDIALMANSNDNGFVCPDVRFIATQMEKAGASEHEITEKLLTVLMKANLLEDIGACLRRYNNISDKILSKTLAYLLQNLKSIPDNDENYTLLNGMTNSNNAGDSKNDHNKNKPYHEKNFPTAVKDVLDILLSCSFDAAAIAVHIRKDVEYPQVLLIIQHLYNVMVNPQLPLVNERPSLYHSSCDQELQILRWFGVFLNSHFQKLALSKDLVLVELLFKWHELFQSYKQEIVQLETVAALLYNIVERKKIFKSNSSRWYSIEEVSLF